MSAELSIPRRLLNADFHNALPAQYNGCHPREDLYASVRPGFQAAWEAMGNKLIPSSEWRAVAEALNPQLKTLSRRRANQGITNESSCVLCAGTGSLFVSLGQVLGPLNTPDLSAMSAYMEVTNSRGSGTSIQRGQRQLREVGCLPERNEFNKRWPFQHTMVQNDWRVAHQQQKEMPGWKETAGLLRIDEEYDIDSPEEFVTALYNGFGVPYARSGHCIRGAWLEFDGSDPVLRYEDSYGEDASWTVNGYGADSFRKWKAAIYGAVAVRTTIIPNILQPQVAA